MVLKKDTYPDSIQCLYESSNVLASKYDPQGKKLAIIFKSGRQYLYENVSSRDYNTFEKAQSQGAVLKSTLGKYQYSHAATVETEFFEHSIEYLKQARRS